MGWDMWLLMVTGTVTFWLVILLGLRALLLDSKSVDGGAEPRVVQPDRASLDHDSHALGLIDEPSSQTRKAVE